MQQPYIDTSPYKVSECSLVQFLSDMKLHCVFDSSDITILTELHNSSNPFRSGQMNLQVVDNGIL